MNLRQNFWVLLILMLSLFLLITGCAQQTAEKLDKTEMNVGMAFEPENLDPAQAWNGWFVLQSGMGETLFRLNKELEVEPWLVESWEQKNDLTWEFELKEGITFHNGEPVDGEAVKESLLRALELNDRAGDLLSIEEIEVITDNKFRIITAEPNPILLNSLADPLTVIVNAELAEKRGTEFAQNPSLTGPYKLHNYSQDEEVAVKRNDQYWNGNPELKQVNFKFIADGTSRTMALQSGEIDIGQNIPPANLETIAGAKGLEVDSISSLRVHMIYFNLDNIPFDNPKVRKAISKAIDRTALAGEVMQGAAIPAEGPFPSVLPFGGDELTGDSYDPSQADKLLTEAGWNLQEDEIRHKNGQKLKLTLHTYNSRPELPVIAEIIQSQLDQIGIKLEVEVRENLSRVLDSGSFDLALYSMNTAPIGDPQYFLNLVFKTDSSSNFGNFSDDKVDELITELNKTYSVAQREELAVEIQERILDCTSHLFLVYPTVNMGVREGIIGYQVHPAEFYLLDETVRWE